MLKLPRLILAVTLLVAALYTTLPAHASHDGVRHESRRLQWLDARVGNTLSNGQKQVIDPLLDITNRQENAIRKSSSLSSAEKKTECHTLHARCWAQISSILTPQQRQAFADSKRRGDVEPAGTQ